MWVTISPPCFSKVLGIHSLLDLLVLIRKLLGLADHLLDLFLGQSALVVGDGNLLRLSGASAVSQTGTGTVTGEWLQNIWNHKRPEMIAELGGLRCETRRTHVLSCYISFLLRGMYIKYQQGLPPQRHRLLLTPRGPCLPRQRSKCRWSQSQRSLRSVADHGELEGYRRAQTWRWWQFSLCFSYAHDEQARANPKHLCHLLQQCWELGNASSMIMHLQIKKDDHVIQY